MRKKKTGIKVSRANATSANLTKPSKPKHRGKRLLIVCGIVVVLVGLAIAGDDYLQLPWLEEMYHRECGGVNPAQLIRNKCRPRKSACDLI